MGFLLRVGGDGRKEEPVEPMPRKRQKIRKFSNGWKLDPTHALDRLGEAARHVDVVVPGHGAVAEGPEVTARLAADRAYIDALRQGEEPVDARLGQDWLAGPHQSNLEQAGHSNG